MLFCRALPSVGLCCIVLLMFALVWCVLFGFVFACFVLSYVACVA